MIILGYQGIGKSTLANSLMQCRYLDLESSNFFVNGKRDNNWARIYCNIAENLSSQNNNVFMSTHSVVRDVLKTDLSCGKIDSSNILTICPAPSLKDDWIDKLQTRYDNIRSDKNYKAYMNAVERYDENIQELIQFSASTQTGLIVISDMNYVLGDLLDNWMMNIVR